MTNVTTPFREVSAAAAAAVAAEVRACGLSALPRGRGEGWGSGDVPAEVTLARWCRRGGVIALGSWPAWLRRRLGAPYSLPAEEGGVTE